MGRAGITASYIAKACNITAQSIEWARELRWGKANGDANDRKSPWTIKDTYIEPNEKTIVIVCHGGVISAFISHLTNVPYYALHISYWS